ncbi:MAG: hypothetical protein IJX50_04255 [Clostridia bacterium]|nr:hypothetical protein [Clostridia bacterium]
MNLSNKSDFESIDYNTSLSLEDIAYDTAYNNAFATLFPLLNRFESTLTSDGKALLSELIKTFTAVLEKQVRRSYREGFSDGGQTE